MILKCAEESKVAQLVNAGVKTVTIMFMLYQLLCFCLFHKIISSNFIRLLIPLLLLSSDILKM